MIRIVKADKNMECDVCNLVTITKGANYLEFDDGLIQESACPFCVRNIYCEVEKRNNALTLHEKMDFKMASLRHCNQFLQEEKG
jgi:hypothetical protein